MLVGYRLWDGLQLGDVVKAFVVTTLFTALWVIEEFSRERNTIVLRRFILLFAGITEVPLLLRRLKP